MIDQTTTRNGGTWAVVRRADGTIRRIVGPAGDLPPTEEQFRKIMEA